MGGKDEEPGQYARANLRAMCGTPGSEAVRILSSTSVIRLTSVTTWNQRSRERGAPGEQRWSKHQDEDEPPASAPLPSALRTSCRGQFLQEGNDIAGCRGSQRLCAQSLGLPRE